jgi:hypothetical protein
MKIIRPLQISINNQVIEQDRKFYLTLSLNIGINLTTGEELLDIFYLKDIFGAMGETPIPDTGMPKPNGEFLVSGSYFSPDNKKIKGGEVKVKIENIEKNLYVFGRRKWEGNIISEPLEIESCPIDYKYSFGGKNFQKNPDGIGFNDGLLPCIEYPEKLITSKNEFPEPAGFGPLQPMHPDRMKYHGTYDKDYKIKFYPGYPDDHNWKFFLCAPKDQWIQGFFKGNEYFEIHNMHPEFPLIKGSLPGLYPRCFINKNNNFSELSLNLDTVWFFPEKNLGLLIFRGVIEVEDDEADSVDEILCSYENMADKPKTQNYYMNALRLRKDNNDEFLNNLKTKDLIPEGHKSAMEILLSNVSNSQETSDFGKNMDAKFIGIQKKAEEKTHEIINNIDLNLNDHDYENLPENFKKDKFDIKNLMSKPSDSQTDPDVEKLNKELNSLIPGIVKGDKNKLDLSEFSFEKLDKIFEALDKLSEKKQSQAKTIAKNEVLKTKTSINNQIKTLENEIKKIKESDFNTDNLAKLEESKEKIKQALNALNEIDFDKKEKSVLPRFNSKHIIEQIKKSSALTDPLINEAYQHLEFMKNAESDPEQIKKMEENILSA